MQRRQSLWLLSGMLSLSLTPFVFGVGWGISEAHLLTTESIESASGFMYGAAMPLSSFPLLFETSGDSVAHPRTSGTRLYEDERRLGPAHRPHDFIRDEGGGQFSHWGTALYFSASDGSDPRSNGRTYTVLTAARLPSRAIWFWAVCVLLSATLFRLQQRPVARVSDAGRTLRSASAVSFVLLMLILVRCSLDPASDTQTLRGLWAAVLLGGVTLAWLSGEVLSSVAPRSIAEAQGRWTEMFARVDHLFTRPGSLGWTLRAVSLFIPFIVFATIVRLPLAPRFLNDAYSSVSSLALPIGLVFLFQLRRDWIGLVAGLTATLALFVLPLASLWQHVAIHYSAVGGLLPFSDANGYYYDARRLMEGHPLGWSARRPLFVGLLATLLTVTGRDLQLSVAILVVLNGIGAFLLAREIRITHGPVAAALATLVLFLFYRQEGGCGTTLTENFGFALGTAAFAVLWRAIREAELYRTWLAIALLTVALMARAGAFFVLPALVVATAWVFRERGRWRVGLGAVAAMLIAASLSLGLARILSDPRVAQTSFSNFSYTLYGLAVGGKGWQQVVTDHPEAREGRDIYALALDEIRADPLRLVQGSLRMWRTYLRPGERYNSAFAFARDPDYGGLFQNLCYAASGLAVLLALRRRREPLMIVLLAATVGHLASIPFVPPIDAGLRAYAATMPILAILVGVGAAGLIEGAGRMVRAARVISLPATSRAPLPDSAPAFAQWFGVGLTAVAVVGPFCVFFFGRPPVLAPAPCAAGTKAVHVRFSRGSFLRIIGNLPDVDDTRIAVPDVRRRDLLWTAGVVQLKNDANQFTPGRTLVNTYDLATGRLLWLVASSDLLPRESGIIQVCGHDSADPLSQEHGVFYADAAPREGSGRSTMWPPAVLVRASAARGGRDRPVQPLDDDR